MRTLTSGMAAANTAQGSFLGWLVEITTSSGSVIRLNTMDVDFSFGGNTFNAGNVVAGGMSWDGGVARPATLTIGDPDLSYWALVLNFILVDAKVRIWTVYNDAPTEGLASWSGRLGKATRAGLTVQFTLSNDSDTTYSPRTRVQQLVNPAFLLPSGTRIMIGGNVWVINRPSTAT